MPTGSEEEAAHYFGDAKLPTNDTASPPLELSPSGSAKTASTIRAEDLMRLRVEQDMAQLSVMSSATYGATGAAANTLVAADEEGGSSGTWQ